MGFQLVPRRYHTQRTVVQFPQTPPLTPTDRNVTPHIKSNNGHTITDTSNKIVDNHQINITLENHINVLLSNKKFPSSSSLERLAKDVQSAVLDFRTLINYRLYIQQLQQTDYFNNQPLWFIYMTCVRPLISKYGVENYTLRVQRFLDLASLLQSYHNEEDMTTLKKLVLPDLIDTLQQSILLSDSEITASLLEIYLKLFKKLNGEDSKTLMICALRNGDAETLENLTKGVDNRAEFISDLERAQLLECASGNFKYEYLSEILAEDHSPMDSYKISLIVQSLSVSLSVKNTFQLIEFLTSTQTAPNLETSHFDFIINQMLKETKELTLSRKNYTPDRSQSFVKPRKVFLQRVDIKEYYKNNIPTNTDLCSLFFNTFLKSLTKQTNITGILYAYTLIKSHEMFTNETYEILQHAISRGNDARLRRFEIYQFSRKILSGKDDFSLRNWEFIFEGVLKGPEYNEDLQFYLKEFNDMGFHLTDSPRIQTLFESKNINVEHLLNDRTSLDEFEPKESNIYDFKETQALKRFHKQYEHHFII